MPEKIPPLGDFDIDPSGKPKGGFLIGAKLVRVNNQLAALRLECADSPAHYDAISAGTAVPSAVQVMLLNDRISGLAELLLSLEPSEDAALSSGSHH